MRPYVAPYIVNESRWLDPAFEPEEEVMAKDLTPTNLMSPKKPCLEGQADLIQSAPPNDPYISACGKVPLSAARNVIQRRKLQGPPKLKRKFPKLGDFCRFPCCEERDSIERHLESEKDASHRRLLELHNAQRARNEEVQQLASEVERLHLELESENGADESVEALRSRLELLEKRAKQDYEDMQAKVRTQDAEVAALRLQTQQAQRELRTLSSRLAAQKEAHQHELALVLEQGEKQKAWKPLDDEFRSTLDQTQELQGKLGEAEALREASNNELQETRKNHEDEVAALNAELASLTQTPVAIGNDSVRGVLDAAAGIVADVQQQSAEAELSRRVAITSELLEDIKALQGPAEELMKLFGEKLPETGCDSLSDIEMSTQWVSALAGSIDRLCANLQSRMANQ
jgi:HAMP domain-containing protein